VTNKLPLLGLLWIAPALLAGCTVESVCTTEARSSVTVQVFDNLGFPVVDADVTYAIGSGLDQACDSISNDGSYVCGYEQEGDFTITVTKGTATKTEKLTVTSDECHVKSQTVKVTLGV